MSFPDPNPLPKETFVQWFNRQKFKHFSADEFTSYFKTKRRGIKNSEPPRSMWHCIVPTLRIVDEVRAETGRACVIISSYRSPAYNAPINGAAKKSYHMQFIALDVVFAGLTPRQVHALFLAKRKARKFKGGLGLYSTFVHIDTRGRNADW